jgi:MFS family permease
MSETKYGAVPTNGKELSVDRYSGLVLCSWLSTMLFSGTIYGWASLSIMLVSEGVLHQSCESDEVCHTQEENLALIYSLGATIQVFSSFVVGYSIDVFGPLKCIVTSGICLFIGTVLFATADTDDFYQYIIAICFTAIGSNFCYLTSFACSFVVEASYLSTYNTGEYQHISAAADTAQMVYSIAIVMSTAKKRTNRTTSLLSPNIPSRVIIIIITITITITIIITTTTTTIIIFIT